MSVFWFCTTKTYRFNESFQIVFTPINTFRQIQSFKIFSGEFPCKMLILLVILFVYYLLILFIYGRLIADLTKISKSNNYRFFAMPQSYIYMVAQKQS